MDTDLPPPLDVDRIVETLRRHEVDFVVVVGLAVLAHGHPRTTFGFDFVADLSTEIMARLAALRELGARVRGVDGDQPEVDPRDPEQLASGANWTFVTDAGWLDFMPVPRVPAGTPRSQPMRCPSATVRSASSDWTI